MSEITLGQIRHVILDELDRLQWHFYERPGTVDDAYANEQRLTFADRVLKRLCERRTEFQPGGVTLRGPRTVEVPGVGLTLTAGGLTEVYADVLREQARKAHLAAARAWDSVSVLTGDPEHPKDCPCQVAAIRAETATGEANEATKLAEPNEAAFHATSAAILAASMRMPAEAIAAHQRAANAYARTVFSDGAALELNDQKAAREALYERNNTPAFLRVSPANDVDAALGHLQELGLIEVKE